MNHFPFFLNLKNKEVIIFGGGNHAYTKIMKLKDFGPEIKVISKNISDKIKDIKDISFIEKPFEKSDLDGFPPLVVIAEKEEITAKIYEECKKRHILVNAVDLPQYCDIIFPSFIATKNLCIGISSGGISPTATVEFKEQIENIIPDNIDDIISQMVPLRNYINESCNKDERKNLLRTIFKKSLLEKRVLTEKEINDIIKDKL